MSQGHTDKATINQRLRLTDEMRDLLASMCCVPIRWPDCDQGTKNRLRALMNRGFAAWRSDTLVTITQAGQDALQ
jgi:hypothetical protein